MAQQAQRPDALRKQIELEPEGSTDAAILDGLERQQAWAAVALYDAVSSVVGQSLYRVLQSGGGDFDDLVRKTFERIVRTIAERKFWVECSLTVCASIVAVGVAMEALRARDRRRREVELRASVDAEHDPFPRSTTTERLETRSETVSMQRVLAEMKADLAEIVFLCDVMGYSATDVASVLGLTSDMVQLRLVQGRRDFLRRYQEAQQARQAS